MKFELDTAIEEMSRSFEDIWDELQNQLGHTIMRADLKALLRATKNLLIKRLKGNNYTKMQDWEDALLTSMTNQTSLDDFFREYMQYYYTNDVQSAVKKNYKTKTTYARKSTYSYQYNRRPTNKLKYKVVFNNEVSNFIKRMMTENKNREWGVAFSFSLDKENKIINVDKIYIMPVTSSGGEVKFVNESEFVIFAELSELSQFYTDITKKDRFAGMMHSHHEMGSWHSTTDHSTIDTYLKDYNHILSMVWSYKDKSGINVDIIYKEKVDNKENGYIIEDFEFDTDLKVDDQELIDLDINLVNRYNDMIKIVEENYKSYENFLKKFEKSKKYSKIFKLYNDLNDDNISTIDKSLIKELI